MRFKAQTSRMLLFRTVLFAACLIGSAAYAGDTPLPTKPFDLHDARTYSNLCYHLESGDVLGFRVLVQAPGREPRVAIQFGEGGLSEPVAVVSHPMPKGALRFSISRSDPSGGLTGSLRGRHGVLRDFNEYGGLHRLRLRDDTHGFPDCR
jgi:hypothetical protein